MIHGGSPRIFFHRLALSAIADGAWRVFLLGRFLPAQNGAWWTCFPTAEQAKRRKESNELPPGFQETIRSDSQGSGRRGSRDNVSTRVSGENDWSDVAAADVGSCARNFPRRRFRARRSPWWTLWTGLGAAGCPQVHRGRGLRLKKKEAEASFSSMDCFLPSIYRPTILLPSRKAGFLRKSG